MRTVNFPFLSILIVVAATAGTGIYFLHDWQLHRNAQFLLTMADRYEETDQPVQAAGALGRYVGLVPDDTAVLARLGLLEAQLHADAPAFIYLEQVLRREPGRQEVRRKLVDVAMRMGRFTDAREHLEQSLLKSNPDDTALLNRLAICRDKLGDGEAAAALYEQAIAAQPEFLDSYAALTRLLLRHDDSDRAEKVLQQLIDNNQAPERAFRAHLLRASLVFEQTRSPMSLADRDRLLAQAEVDASQALDCEGDHAAAFLLAAELARTRSLSQRDDQASRERARKYVSLGLALDVDGQTPGGPVLAALYKLQARLELDDGRSEAAIDALRRGVARLERPADDAALQWSLAETLIDADQLSDAQKEIDGLRAESVFAPYVTYLDARCKLAQGQWQQGTAELERLRPRLARGSELARQVDFWLGRGYGALNREEEELAAYRRAVEADDHWAAARCVLAAALEKAGRAHDAVENYRQALQLAGCPPEVYQALARLRVAETLRQPPAKQDWEKVESLLKAAEERLPDSVQLAVWRAQAEAARGAWDDARRRLQQLSASYPEELDVWLASVALERLTGNWQEAERLLSTAQQHLGDQVDLRLERASLVEGRDGAMSVAELVSLAQDAATFSADDRARLCVGLARRLQALGDMGQAEELARKVVADSPQNLPANLLLFDLAVAAHDDGAMDKWLRKIGSCADADAPVLSLYGTAVRQVLDIEKSPHPADEALQAKLRTASDALNEALGHRPAWPRLALWQGRIEELRGQPARAVLWYQQAVDLGAGDDVAIHLIVLSVGQQDYERAERLLRRLDEKQTPLTPNVGPSAFEALAQRNDFAKALDLAYKACSASDDYRHHVWFGRIATEVVLGGKLRDADQRETWLAQAARSAERAVELAPHEPDAWFGLLHFYSRASRPADVESAIQRAKQELTPVEWHLLLTSYYQAIDQKPTAGEQLELALKDQPDDAKTLRFAAQFHMTHRQMAEAKTVLEHLLDPRVPADPTDRAFARQSLAVLYLTDGTYKGFLNSVAMAEGDDPQLPVNRRATAILLARSPVGADCRRAIEILDELGGQSLLDDSDRHLLAQVCWKQRQHERAIEVMEALLEKAPENADYVASSARMLLDENRLDDAERFIRRLQRLEAQSVRIAELEARLLVRQGNQTKAISELEHMLEGQETAAPDAPRFDRLQLAGLLEAIATWKPAGDAISTDALLKAAERHFRKAAADSPTNPERQAALAGFLGRHGSVNDALPIYDQLWSSGRLEAAAAGWANLAQRHKLAEARLSAAEEQIEQALVNAPQSTVFLSALASVVRARGEFDKLEALYRRMLEANPNNVMALNNLTVLLALSGRDGDEARRLIEHAVELSGPSAALLDTRALVSLAAGQSQAAIEDLQQATADEPLPEYYLHLAQVHLLRDEVRAAARAMKTARSLGLDEDELHPLERDDYQRTLAVLPSLGD